MRKDGRDLERAHDAETRHVCRRERGDVAPLIDDASACRLQELGQQIEAGGLASAVRSDQRVNSPACDAQAHAVHRDKTGKFLGEVLGLEDDLGTHRRNASRVLHCPYVWSDRPAPKLEQPSSYSAPTGRCGSISLATRKDFLDPRHHMHPHGFYSMDYDASQ